MAPLKSVISDGVMSVCKTILWWNAEKYTSDMTTNWRDTIADIATTYVVISFWNQLAFWLNFG